jgi:hypothetical protein
MARICAGIIAVVGWFALVLQFVLMFGSPDNQSIAPLERIVRFFSFFTIHMNIFVSLTSSAVAFFPRTKVGSFLTHPSVQAAVATFLSIGGIVYSLFLRSVWDPTGWQAVADHLLHDATPVLFFFYWIFFAPKIGLNWLDPLKWLLYPLAYVTYSIIRGAIVNWYPYHFADVGVLGYPTALRNAFFVLIAFLVAGLVFVLIAKLISRTSNTPETAAG